MESSGPDAHVPAGGGGGWGGDGGWRGTSKGTEQSHAPWSGSTTVDSEAGALG